MKQKVDGGMPTDYMDKAGLPSTNDLLYALSIEQMISLPKYDSTNEFDAVDNFEVENKKCEITTRLKVDQRT